MGKTLMFSFKNALWIYALSATAFVALVGGTVWFVQFRPSVREGPVTPQPGDSSNTDREILRFSRKDSSSNDVMAAWELDDQGQDIGYEMEVENNTEGHYFFPFRNVLGVPVELGFLQSACDCSSGDVCLMPASEWKAIDALLARTPWAEPSFSSPPQWRTLRGDDKTPFLVPADGHGVIRIHWDAHKRVGSHLRIAVQFWSRAVAEPKMRQINQLRVPVVVAAPLQLAGATAPSVGILEPGALRQDELYFWSATRDHPDVAFAPREATPHFRLVARPLSAEECVDLQKKLRGQGTRTRVRAGFRVSATIQELAEEQHMSQGRFEFAISIKIDEIPAEMTPTVTGTVKGEVEVGGPQDQEKVQLGTFPSSDKRVVVVPLFADPKLTIEPSVSNPKFLHVELKRSPKGSTPQRAQWDLKVTVPAHAWSGPLPAHATITLRVPGPQPRLINIPVVGVATQ
jgi:hypothetical protein